MTARIAIVDPVGAKAGMDIYSLQLLKAISLQLNTRPILLSNFNSTESSVYVKNVFCNRNLSGLLSGLLIALGLIRSLFILRKNKVQWVIHHVFRFDRLELITSFLFRKAGFKMLFVAHDITPLDVKSKKIVAGKKFLSYHDAIVVHNEFSKKEFLKNFGKENSRKVFVIPHGNFIEQYENSGNELNPHEYFQLDISKQYILFFGQIKKAKGLDVLLRALVHVKSECVLIIAGKMRDAGWSDYQQIIDANQLQQKVHCLIRHISDHERDMLFRLAGAVMLPYQHIYQSGVLMMAMSYGKAVVASDLPPFAEIIEDGKNGLLFERGNSQALAAQIDRLFFHDDLRKSVGYQAFRAMAEKFSWKDIASRYIEIFSEFNH